MPVICDTGSWSMRLGGKRSWERIASLPRNWHFSHLFVVWNDKEVKKGLVDIVRAIGMGFFISLKKIIFSIFSSHVKSAWKVHFSFSTFLWTFFLLGHSRPLFLTFVFLIQFIVNKICRWLDSNSGSLALEATAPPTEPQPLPQSVNVFTKASPFPFYAFSFAP